MARGRGVVRALGDGDGPATALGPAGFRYVLGHFCTGVAVVTALHRGQPVGMTIQSLTSVSLTPPLVSICPAKASASWPCIKSAGVFCVNILRDEQEVVSRVFAAKGGDRFEDVRWRRAPGTGSPLLDDVLAWIDCRIQAEHDAGDHVITVGRVLGLGARSRGRPLLFYRGGYGAFQPPRRVPVARPSYQ